MKKGTILQRVIFPGQVDAAASDCPLFQRAAGAWVRQVALGVAISVFAWPVCSAERDAPASAAIELVSPASSPLVPEVPDEAEIADFPVDEEAPPEPDPKPVRKPIRKAAAEPGRAKAVVGKLSRPQPARKSGRTSITRTSFQNDASRLLDPIPESDSPRESAGLTLRPFRKIHEIVPYDNYEPDPEVAAHDPCYNLCPRPQGGDCRDCNSDDSEGGANGMSCPECPWEQDLRRLGRKPGEPNIPFVPRDFAHIHYCWEPTNLYHNPIYFEDVLLERYGHTRHYIGIQPLVSTARFAVQLVGLPYQMSLFPVWDRQYSLGYYRPGEYVPYKYFQIPLNGRAAAVEAGVITGSYFLFAPGVGP